MVKGVVYDVQTVTEGQGALKPTTPSNYQAEWTSSDGLIYLPSATYFFMGWDKDFSNITSDLIINARHNVWILD